MERGKVELGTGLGRGIISASAEVWVDLPRRSSSESNRFGISMENRSDEEVLEGRRVSLCSLVLWDLNARLAGNLAMT